MKKYIPLLIAVSVFAGCSNNAPAAQPTVYAETPDITESAVVTTAPSSITSVTTTVTTAVETENPFGRFSVTDEDFNGITDDDIRSIYYSKLRSEDFVDDYYVSEQRDSDYDIIFVPESKEYDEWSRRIPDGDPQPSSTTPIEENDLYTAYCDDYDNGRQIIWLKPKDLKLIWDQNLRYTGKDDPAQITRNLDLITQHELVIARELNRLDKGYSYDYLTVSKDVHSANIVLYRKQYLINTEKGCIYNKAYILSSRNVKDLNDIMDPSATTDISSSVTEPGTTEPEPAPEVKYEKAVFDRETYDNGSPRYNDKNAVKDITMSEERKYIMTDDKGEGKCGPREDFFYASIPVGDDMPSRIEFIDIDTDEFVGYMYDDGNAENGDEKAGDGIYSIKMTYFIDIDRDPDVSDSWSRCYFGLYTDSEGRNHTCELPTFVNVQEPVTLKERAGWDEVQDRIAAITSSEEYASATTDEKQEMLLNELDKLADEGLVYRDLTRTNSTPRSVVYKIVKGPTVIVELEPCECGYGYDDSVCDDIK